MLASHAAWGAMFCRIGGNNYLMLRISMFVLSAATAIALYAWCRRQGHSTNLAVWCAVTFALNPLVVALEYTFMTDLTGAALATLLVVICPSLTQARLPSFAGYGTLGGVAYLSRQTASIPFLLTAAALAWQVLRGKQRLRALYWTLIPFPALVLGYHFWLQWIHGVPSNQKFSLLRFESFHVHADRVLRIITGLALQLWPCAVLLAASSLGSRARRNWPLAILIGAAIAGFSFAITGSWPTPYGGEIFDLGLRHLELSPETSPLQLRGPRWRWGSMEVSLFQATSIAISIGSASILLAFAIRGKADNENNAGRAAWSTKLASLSLVATAALFVVTWIFFERYLLSLFPLALLAFAAVLPPEKSRNPRAMCVAWAATLLAGLLVLFGIQDGMQRSRTFWSTARLLHSLGFPPQSIDGGLAYRGFYCYNPTYPGAANIGPHLDMISERERDYLIATTSPLTPTAERPVRLSFGEAEGYRVIARCPFRSWFRTGDVLVLIRQNVEVANLPSPFREWLKENGADRAPAE